MSARVADPYLLGWPLWVSTGVHGVALATVAATLTLVPATLPDPIPIEVVRVEPPPPPPPPAPKTQPVAKVTPPRLLTRPTELPQPAPLPPAALTETPRRVDPLPVAELPDSGRRFLAAASSESSLAIRGAPGSSEGAGKLFATGDLPIAGRPGGSGGGGAGGGGGTRRATQVAATGDSAGLTSFARPVGGYQTPPRYPDAARRQGIEGETLLRFQVLATGRVAAVSVEKSAGHADLDRAAAEAVKTWLFEPARRGREAVAVWVTLPVRFSLESGVGQ